MTTSMAPTSPVPRPITLQTARRLAVTCQGLASAPRVGPAAGRRRAPVTVEDLVGVVERLGYVQLDPISVVERSPLLVLWSRLGPFPPALLDEALYERRSLFEYWAHAAAIVSTTDLPLHRWRMERFRDGATLWGRRIDRYLAEHHEVRTAIMERLAAEGPLPGQVFDGPGVLADSDGWSERRDVDRILAFLWLQGHVVVAGRPGGRGRRLWGSAEGWWPPGASQEVLPEEDVLRRRFVQSRRALGVSTPRHSTGAANGYRQGAERRIAAELVQSGELVPVRVVTPSGQPLAGEWHVHAHDMPLLEEIEAGGFRGRTVLLSPFDNLIIERARVEQLFGFVYRMEIYVPRPKRRFGYYALPILHGDRLIGRIDTAADRKRGVLRVLSMHAEAGAPAGAGVGKAVRSAVEQLARCCDLDGVEVVPGSPAPGVPVSWSEHLG
jgi:uncharacterized protein YcaQ